MSAHEFRNGPRCIHCGTLASSTGQTACPGPQRHDAPALRPEPERRQYASEDFDTIGARLAELAAERTAAMNEAESGVVPVIIALLILAGVGVIGIIDVVFFGGQIGVELSRAIR